MMADHEIPITYSGPYSFDVSPCETFFARLKEGNLNLDDRKLTRR